jgi:pyruvyl transferase EpsO
MSLFQNPVGFGTASNKMNFCEKNETLKKLITDTLAPVITDDYWYLGLPYYSNIGDILIWHGTEVFLKQLSVSCKYKSSGITFKHKRISKDTIILLQGGGNFGDIWNEHNDFRKMIIKEYAMNKIIILPQTVFYFDKNKLISDAELFSKHHNLVICARDTKSYKLLREYFFSNTVLLLPDMAFCIRPETLMEYTVPQGEKGLYLKRMDKEINLEINYNKYINEAAIDVQDWPSMEKSLAGLFLMSKLLGASRRIPWLFSDLTDKYASRVFKPAMIRQGVNFISQYGRIYTTRLHAAILCSLLKKPFVLFDNSYGKNSRFYETWFSDLDGAAFISC